MQGGESVGSENGNRGGRNNSRVSEGGVFKGLVGPTRRKGDATEKRNEGNHINRYKNKARRITGLQRPIYSKPSGGKKKGNDW